ncbi:MAG: prepilin-type N-terminal cleavage/methylation domain-containing protein [Erysipelothrix sp.]|nr:prepilin-type N-terminal cleavage/methylation domain-containing protein [Erysipelothrix sp.]
MVTISLNKGFILIEVLIAMLVLSFIVNNVVAITKISNLKHVLKETYEKGV